MSTSTKDAPAKAAAKTETPAATPAKVLFQGRVAVELIDVRDQVRKKFDENAHKELTESIRTKDVINPITLRPGKKDGRYELVAGERRFRAAKAAGLKDVPAVVRELDEQAASLYQVEENIHRKDLTPIEEARGFQILTRGGATGPAKYTVDQLAKLVDKSVAYVYRSINLLELPKDAIEAIESGKLTPAHGHQILRIPPFKRQELVDQLLGASWVMTAADLRNHVEASLGRDLSAVAFPKDKAYAGMEACTNCPSNTGNQGVLFDGAQKGMCMNTQCFATKVKQHKADYLEKVKAANPKAQFVEYARGNQVFAGMMRAGGFTVKEKLADSKKTPKTDFGLLIGGDFRVWVAVLDKKEEKESAKAPAPKPADPKEQFTQEVIAQAIYAAAADAAKLLKMEKKDWAELAIRAYMDLPDEITTAMVDLPDGPVSIEAFAKASETILRAIVLANLRLPYQPTDADWKKLGVDVAGVKKAAKAKADKLWAERAAEKPKP
jgi:ParB family chromosome partitioning protein